MKEAARILVINSGSSSIKFSLFQMGRLEELILAGELDRIGLEKGLFQANDGKGRTIKDQEMILPSHGAALEALFQWLGKHSIGRNLDAVGHRVVHGGRHHFKPHLITPRLMADLKNLIPLAPDHLPHEIKAIQEVTRLFPDLPQAASFDTAFHRSMPELAQFYALPRHYRQEGVMRYGFHGLSYEYITMELARKAEPEEIGKLIIAHLGNGASMAAIQDGKSIDTTMGLTPAGGLVMSTRSGDLDPGVILYLLQEKRMSPVGVNDLVNNQAGLLGVSGISSDMKDLLDKENLEEPAAEAIALFCYQARKFLGALAAVLGGLNTLVFTGGIGEKSPIIREMICQNLGFLGIQVDPDLNFGDASIISRQNSPVTVRVMKTNEELMVARHTRDILEKA